MPSDLTRPSRGAAPQAIDELVGRSDQAFALATASEPADRARWMAAVADALDAAGGELVVLAQQETHLAATRLSSEVARTSGQLRLLAAAAREGACFEVTIDHADPTATPPTPDLRRMLHAVGPVVVFAAGNFPFAFSVLGGDTAAAWAAGCSVLMKTHPGHPQLSQATLRVARRALEDAGAPADLIIGFDGQQAGLDVLAHPRVRAGSFTGSERVGRLLLAVADNRDEPIPFYGELGSVNPVIVLPGAARRQADTVAAGFAASLTMGRGQFCTKPGLVAVPDAESVAAAVGEHLSGEAPGPMLTPGIDRAFRDGVDSWSADPEIQVVHDGLSVEGAVNPWLGTVAITRFLADPVSYSGERFGPAALLVEYDDKDAATLGETLDRFVDVLPGSLTATIHADLADAGDVALATRLTARLSRRCGRVILNGWPTGVAVSWAMHHGGPWPATTGSLHTSVGPTSIRRFLTPVCYQNLPEAMLPPLLRDGRTDLPRRVDGVLATTHPLPAESASDE
ncbi:aldehyde dehydrogenase family protein [Nakamurella deserti]|uniref:aldehyde dehydrogenase family protein n=1 Tax=Nakamurella deserti TaxID=2164074 RepID=UPI000DBE66F3|nr:aldehyde dehydrogenase family protein [Nakamurella deserti]